MSEAERRYDDGTDPKLLDVIFVPLAKALPSERQPENWLLDPEWYWELTNRFETSKLGDIADRPQRLWTPGWSSVQGSNDRVPDTIPPDGSPSLALIRATELMVRVVRPGEAFGSPRRQVRGRFEYGGLPYDFAITDPSIERPYLARSDGEYKVGDRFITVSLAESYNGFAYKLIAAVFDV